MASHRVCSALVSPLRIAGKPSQRTYSQWAPGVRLEPITFQLLGGAVKVL
jgi:hypothetical protein